MIANTLAKISGTQHRFFELDQRYLGEFMEQLRNMVALTDGMYLTHGVTEMLALQFARYRHHHVAARARGRVG